MNGTANGVLMTTHAEMQTSVSARPARAQSARLSHKCKDCGKTFATFTALKSHAKSHLLGRQNSRRARATETDPAVPFDLSARRATTENVGTGQRQLGRTQTYDHATGSNKGKALLRWLSTNLHHTKTASPPVTPRRESEDVPAARATVHTVDPDAKSKASKKGAFAWQHALVLHRLETHRVAHLCTEHQHTCKVCGERFGTFTALKAHAVRHFKAHGTTSRRRDTRETPRTTTDEVTQLKDIGSRRRVTRDPDEQTLYACITCGAEFGTFATYKAHAKVHVFESDAADRSSRASAIHPTEVEALPQADGKARLDIPLSDADGSPGGCYGRAFSSPVLSPAAVERRTLSGRVQSSPVYEHPPSPSQTKFSPSSPLPNVPSSDEDGVAARL